ncbi:YopX family protein [Bacillus paranthracis]|uniref:YopX family protein n=1 Tax=Bacillus paranthracis TaxID=2026186 RepID=UPI003D645DE3
MREIKFRGYIRDKKRMIYADINEIAKGSWSSPLYWCDLMQYTGLKDKNGKEIYEGDILECTSELLTNFGKTKTGRYETTYKQVIWLTDSWGYRVLKSKHIVEGAERKGLEVAIKFGVICGNIYENPELLQGSDEE